MHQCIPKIIRPLLEEYLLLNNQQLHDLLNGFYLVGSIALDEFNERFSDIDFVAVLNRKVTSAEIKDLRDIHRALEKHHPRMEMSGSYILPQDLGKWKDETDPHLHYHDGVLHLNVRSDLNSITWWELKNHGIPVIGKPPYELPFQVDWDLLVEGMRENLNSYWAGWANRPERILVLYSDWGIQWAVLGVLRQFYTFSENSITTKVRAGRYALGCLPARWHPLIEEAIRIREGQNESAYRFRVARMIEAVRFLRYMIQFCNVSFPRT